MVKYDITVETVFQSFTSLTVTCNMFQVRDVPRITLHECRPV